MLGIRYDDAGEYLRRYTSPSGSFAWPLYDEDPTPTLLTGADLTVTALLSYPLRGSIPNLMGSDGPCSDGAATPNHYRLLFKSLEAFVETDDKATFEALTTEEIHHLATRKTGGEVIGPESWQAFIRCLDAASNCPRMTSVAVTKILHRKRPTLIPINDSRVRAFYGVPHSYPRLFEALHAELTDRPTHERLTALAAPYSTPLGGPMTVLRALDIIVWMHMS